MNITTRYRAALDALRSRYPKDWDIKITEDQHLGEITVTKRCSVTGMGYSITAPWQYFFQWLIQRKYIQTIFSSYTEDEREFLISGTTPAEWNATLGDEEE